MKPVRWSWGVALALLLLAGCRGSAPPAAEPTLEWLEGDWKGVRRAADDGSEAPLTVHVESLTGGPAQVERLQVETGGEPYVGFTVRGPTPDGTWLMLYGNASRKTLARLEGEVEPDRVTWRSVTPGRTRDSRVEIERLDADHWRRTNHVSEDGGRTWRVLFTDELARSE